MVISDFLLSISDLEDQLENKREQLSQETVFNIYEVFRYFDKKSRGYIYVHDFMVGLRDLGLMEIGEDQSLMLMRRYDVDQDGTLKFSEFSNAFAPLN